ncbi:ATP-dependent_RNA helicase [Hexamita inflata]|uniref:ATP-dependent RNA helicase n=1 Tax=Hexamita inflata TaxID=28002 RepID=A0AA86P2K4_9EUKA|nr:ATP-dependent RNA helicase [Hexamita inflata]
MQFDLFGDEEDFQPVTKPIIDVQASQIQEIVTTADASCFQELKISTPICQCLKAHQIVKPTEIQSLAIPVINSGKDCAVISPTSSGKTLTFLLPILSDLQKNPRYFHSLILAPTRELAYQINEQFALLCPVFGLYSSLFIGGQDVLYQNSLVESGCYVMICTPGRLVQVLQSRPKEMIMERLSHLKFLVLDEADQFLNGGQQFNSDISKILTYLPPAAQRQTVLTTASLTKEMNLLLQNSRFKLIESEHKMPQNLTYSYLVVPQPFYFSTFLCFVLEKHTGYQIIFESEMNKNESKITNPSFKQCIIFCKNVEQTELVNRLIIKLGLKSTCLHSALTMEQRIQNINSFRNQNSSFLVATDVAARGLDIPCVQLVINLSFPGTIEDFQHRAGRCARRGEQGEVISFVEPEDFLRFNTVQEKLYVQFELIKKIRNWVRNGATEDVDDENLVRTYFGKVIRNEKEIKIEMIDQDVGHRIQRSKGHKTDKQ